MQNENEWNQINAIVFDIDGTIYSNFFMLLSAPHLYLRNFLWIYRYAKMRKKLRASIKQTEIPLSNKMKFDFEEKSLQLFKATIKEDVNVAKIILEKNIYNTWIHAISKVPLRYQFRTLLRTLKEGGYKIGILTDFRSQEKLTNWNLHSYFDSVICAEDYGVLKPDKRIFQLICDKLQVNTTNTVFVGNHLYYDGIGAAKSGLISLLFYNRKIQTLTQYNISSFCSMFGLKKELNKLGLI